MPGGAPQGCLLGVIFFAVKFNGALLRPAVERPVSLKNDKDKDNKKVKYMDDTSVAVSIQMDRLLADDLVKRHLPLTFSERTRQILPVKDNLLQQLMNEFELFTIENKMLINTKKTKVMKFNRCSKIHFPLEVSFSDNVLLE